MSHLYLCRMVTHFSREYIGPFFKCQDVLRPLKKGSVDSPETSTTNFPPTPHNIPEERRPRIQGDASLKSPLQEAAVCPHVVFHTF